MFIRGKKKSALLTNAFCMDLLYCGSYQPLLSSVGAGRKETYNDGRIQKVPQDGTRAVHGAEE